MVAILPTTLGQVKPTPVSRCVRRCYVSPGTRYYTLDYTTLKYSYYGECKHLLVGTCEGRCCDNQCCNSTLIPEFKVYIRNKLWYTGCQIYSRPKYVEIHHAGNIVRLSASPLQANWINGAGSITTGTYPNFVLSSWSSCGYRYTGPAGLTVYFNCCGYVQVYLDMVYWGKTCGTCGN
mgnify:CR=1 FL=1